MGSDPEILARKQKTSMERTGYDHAMHDPAVQEKLKKQCIKKYGVDNPSKSSIVKEKIRNTFQEKYGVDNISKDPMIIERIRQGAIQRYNDPAQKQEILKKRRNTLITEHGVCSNKHFHISPESIAKYNDLSWLEYQHVNLKKSCEQIAQELGISATPILHRLKLAGVQRNRWQVSAPETQIVEFIKNHYTGLVLTNDRTIIKPHELDIVLPDLNLAIELDGVFWHSEQRGKSRNYHLSKTQKCEQEGFRLLHVYDLEWLNPITNAIIQSRLHHFLGQSTRIPARKCQIKVVTTQQAREFVIQNHIQGWCPSKHSYGLEHNSQLVAVMTLGKSRFNQKISWELLRYCTRLNHTVIGGMGKLLKKASLDLNITELISYADRRWSSTVNNIYEQNGFILTRTSSPNYKYFQINKNNIILESRNKYQKHKLKDLLELFDPKLSEFENMSINNYFRIWDCGNLVYIWRANA